MCASAVFVKPRLLAHYNMISLCDGHWAHDSVSNLMDMVSDCRYKCVDLPSKESNSVQHLKHENARGFRNQAALRDSTTGLKFLVPLFERDKNENDQGQE